MNILKFTFFILLMIGVVSCAGFQTAADRSDYQVGYNAAWKYAKDDAINSNCLTNPRYLDYPARKMYAQTLREQGRSEAFIQGFNSGYKDDLYNLFDFYCD